jgi:hypothetical protein
VLTVTSTAYRLDRVAGDGLGTVDQVKRAGVGVRAAVAAPVLTTRPHNEMRPTAMHTGRRNGCRGRLDVGA